jgi:hypothetical protein
MAEHHADVPVETLPCSRRKALRLLSVAAYGALATGIVGCAQEPVQSRERPDWMRSKQGSNGNGRGRK